MNKPLVLCHTRPRGRGPRPDARVSRLTGRPSAPGGARASSLYDTSPLPTGGAYQDPVTVEIALGEPIVLNQPVIATVTVCVRGPPQPAGHYVRSRSPADRAGKCARLSAGRPAGRRCKQAHFTFRFPHAGYYFFGADTENQFGGLYDARAMDVKITEQRGRDQPDA